MFTGLVQRVGEVRQVRSGPQGATLLVAAAFEEPLALGESVAVDGCCLTVARLSSSGFEAFASLETLQRTTLGHLRAGDPVHLERALRAGDRMGGHIVTGHVDGVGRMTAREPLGESERVTFEVPEELSRFVAPKGSIAVDGVSLTVNEVDGHHFSVVLVPFTRAETTFDRRPVGAPVNVEVDVVARYVARLLEVGGEPTTGRGPSGGA